MVFLKDVIAFRSNHRAALDAGSAYCCVSDGTDPARVSADRYAATRV